MLEGYREYKDINLPWLKSIPKNWDMKRTKSLFIPINERSQKGKEELLSVSSKYGVIKRKNATVTMFKAASYEDYKLCWKNDLVINSLWAWQTGLGFSPYHGIISTAYSVFRLKNLCANYKFLHYLLRGTDYQWELQVRSKGIWRSRYQLSDNSFLDSPIILPPQLEQDQIVRYLDWKVSMINKYINAKKKQVELLKEHKQAIINQAVTKGLDMNVPMKDSGIEWLGKIPAHWNILYLSQVAEEQYISNNEIHNQNLLSLSYGNIVNKDINTTEGLLPASFDTYQIVNHGNVILRLTDLQNDWKSLRVGLATQTGIITSAYVCLFCKDTILPEYLYLLLHSFDIRKVFYGMGGGVRQSIGYKEIRKLLLLVPPQTEQQKISNYCKDIVVEIGNNINHIEKTINLLQEYRTRLISDVVTGKVNVQNVKVPEFEAENDELSDNEQETDADIIPNQ